MNDQRLNSRGGRLRAACDLCRHRKIKCDADKPTCETCRLAGVPCIISPPDPLDKKPSIRDQLTEAQFRIRQLETRNSPQPPPQPSLGIHIRDPANFDEAMEIFRWHLACAGPLSPDSPRGAAFLATVRQSTGYPFDLDTFADHLAKLYAQRHSTRQPRILVPKWPELDLTRKSIEHYTNQNLYSMFPTAEPSRLHEILNHYASNSLSEREKTVTQAFLVAFTAFMTQIHRHLPAFSEAEPDSYILAALTLVPHLILEPRSIEALQAILIIAQYITPTGQTESGHLLLSVAVRMLYNHGAHRIHPTPSNAPHHRHLRALFWACYTMDREMCIRSGQPPLIDDAEVDLALPPNYIGAGSTRQFVDEPLSGDILLYPSDLRLSILKSRIYALLLAPRCSAQSLPGDRKLEVIRHLDSQLAELKASFPAHLRPGPEAYLRPDYKVHDFSLRGMNIHLEYYYCLRVIHEASIVSSMAYPNTETRAGAGSGKPLESSVELYYHAVRSTLLYFIRVEGLVQAPTVWIHAQFILSSSIALFWDMIHNPTANTFSSDLQLLEQMHALFTRLCENCWQGAPLAPLFIFEGFLGMLVEFSREALVRVRPSGA
ncbi:fungal-specific transcription factor domain-containing protein [Aspergillus heterothallicus]